VTVNTWLFFCLTEVVLCLTPGPAVLLVVSMALTRGSPAGFGASLGILAANGIYFAISATSLGALLLASAELFTVVKWAGAVYLVWTGGRMLLAAETLEAAAGRAPARPRKLGAFSYGLWTQGANPKALIFFSAILPQFVDPRGAVGWQLLVFGITSMLIEFAVLGLYVLASQRARDLSGNRRLTGPLNRVGGAFLIGAGARLAFYRG
jgi:homoserine/homoserine lactone efflux protein